MTKQRRHNRWKGHCAMCGHDLGNSTRKWSASFKRSMLVGKTTGRTRRMNRKAIVAAARNEV